MGFQLNTNIIALEQQIESSIDAAKNATSNAIESTSEANAAATNANNAAANANNPVSYLPQTKSDSEKLQARRNIDALALNLGKNLFNIQARTSGKYSYYNGSYGIGNNSNWFTVEIPITSDGLVTNIDMLHANGTCCHFYYDINKNIIGHTFNRVVPFITGAVSVLFCGLESDINVIMIEKGSVSSSTYEAYNPIGGYEGKLPSYIPDNIIEGRSLKNKSVKKEKLDRNFFSVKTSEGAIWENCIDEFYIDSMYLDASSYKAIVLSHSNLIDIWGHGDTVGIYTWKVSIDLSSYNNGDIIPLTCTTAYNAIMVGDIIGYIIFKDITLFKNTQYGSANNIVQVETVSDLYIFTKISKQILATKNQIATYPSIEQTTTNNKNQLNNIVEDVLDDSNSIRSLTYIPDSATFTNYYSDSTFSGFGQYIATVGTFRTLFTKIRCANWNNNTTAVSQVLVQFRQDTNTGVLLKEKLFTLLNPIQPGELKDVILDFGEDISLSGNLFMIIRMNAIAVLQRASSTTYTYTVKGCYFTSGNIISSNTGTIPGSTYYGDLFWRLYSSYKTKTVYNQKSIDDLKSKLNIPDETVEISLPDKIYAIVGDTLQLFYRGMIKHPNPYIYNILVTCSKGKQFPRYFEYLPVSSDVGTVTFKVEVKNKSGQVLGTKTCNLITKSSVKSPTTLTKVLCVGDSLTTSGIWCIEASRRLIGSGGTPAGLALSNISFLGRKTGSGIGWEGNGGWSWTDYATAGRQAYKFYLSGVVTPPAIGATYTNNGVTYTVSEINLTSGSGYISAEGSSAPTSSGTLTKVSGNGDSTLTFSSSIADSGNPFWETDTSSLNFKQYVDTYMGGDCNVIYFLLTWNTQTPFRTDFTSLINAAKTLIDHIHSSYSNCKIKIMGVQIPSLNGGMGADYGATGTGYADGYGMVVTALNMNKAYQDWCNETAYSSFMEFVNVSSQFDSEYNMQCIDKIVNTRQTITEKIGTNGVHPANEGYYQIGDVVFRNFVANFCQ